MNICDKLRKEFEKGEVVAYVKILGERVPVSRDEALRIFGCHNPNKRVPQETKGCL